MPVSSTSSRWTVHRMRMMQSLDEIDPLGVVVPRTEDDVATVVRYAAEHRIPLHARGAGTDT